jgi:menaquinone-9 beta-reductase
MTERADIFIVGGGPAGLAAAILARAKGFSVVVADHAQPPIEKACGEGLMPDTVAALETLGISFAAEEVAPFRGIRFLENSTHTSVEAAFPARCGLAVRRTVLHAKLAQRAADMGATLAWGARVTVLGPRKFACDGLPIETRWIIGADGEGSQIRKWAMPEPARYEQTRFGSRQHFQVRPWTDFVEVHWGRSCQIVVTPSGSVEVGVAVTSRHPHVTIENALLEFPELAQRLAGARVSSRERGTPCALRRLNAVHCGCIALVGDASGSVDPLTGEGLGLAFRQADALTDAMRVHRLKDYERGLEDYERAHERIGRASRRMSRFLLWMDAYPWFRDRVLRALSAEPQLFARLLNTHIDASPAVTFGFGNALKLGWRLVLSPAYSGSLADYHAGSK